ncbi:hypothetical protein GSI_13090 [Ganoderma sinense ZZ0214-1]|uniref:Uncharacterized protein n=1 Tax=Ganoderma sinense ZZ0214-1 TaxID=1077348 RepID=A0A2G8RUL5_9APHY|nr:hypothetical protein GSI_13090 [Ganoderma sinense ZZ0214-1]
MKAETPARHVANPHVDRDVTMADAAAGEPSTSASPSRSNPRAMKRKANVMGSEAPAGSDRLREDAALHTTVPKEYQTGQSLFDGLSRGVETSRASRTSTAAPARYVNFHGSYTIVMDPDVRGERRVKRVVDELKQSGKLRFGNLVKRESEKSRGGHARTFWCACDSPPPPQKHPSPSPTTRDASPSAAIASSQAGALLKRTQSTLVGWLAKSQSKEKSGDEALPVPPPGCGGTITVSAVTDFSHPLGRMGIEGQKIAVRVEHPGRDFKRVLEW